MNEPRVKTAEVVAIVNRNDDLVNGWQEARRGEQPVINAVQKPLKSGRSPIG